MTKVGRFFLSFEVTSPAKAERLLPLALNSRKLLCESPAGIPFGSYLFRTHNPEAFYVV